MFAVIKTGGKQYRVATEQTITIEKLAGAAGDVVAFEHVLMVANGDALTIGAPFVAGATVAGEIVEQGRGPKVISFKKRRRQNSKRKRGHRQDLTVVRITDILTGGARPAARAIPAPVEATPEPSAAVLDRNDLTLISGIGKVYDKKLKALGIETWEQIANWSADDVARWDAELSPKGRVSREEWVAQARDLMNGKPSRLKSAAAGDSDA